MRPIQNRKSADMTEEREIFINGKKEILLISDNYEALLAAKAAGRAVLGVEDPGNGSWTMKGIDYIVPSFEEASDELAELVLLRYLGLPWTITETSHLWIREFVKEDSAWIPAEEYEKEEAIFRSEELLEKYIKSQYHFYEYGTWAVLNRQTKELVGMAGVSNPKLPDHMEKLLPPCTDGKIWLELGYHIFRPYRGNGYGKEAVKAVMDYAQEVLNARTCALIEKKNKASRALAESLGMINFSKWNENGTDTVKCAGYLLYGQNYPSQQNKVDP